MNITFLLFGQDPYNHEEGLQLSDWVFNPNETRLKKYCMKAEEILEVTTYGWAAVLSIGMMPKEGKPSTTVHFWKCNEEKKRVVINEQAKPGAKQAKTIIIDDLLQEMKQPFLVNPFLQQEPLGAMQDENGVGDAEF